MYPAFVHLNVHSAYSFLDSPSSVEGVVLRAAQIEQPALALTDTNSVTGIVSFAQRCRKAGIKPVGGCEVILEGGYRLTLLMDGPMGWASLCRLLSLAAMRDTEREGLRVRTEDIAHNLDGLLCLSGATDKGEVPRLLSQKRYREAKEVATRWRDVFGPDGYYMEVSRTLRPGERRVSELVFQLADHLGVKAIATNAVHHATKAETPLWEAVCRVRLGLAPQEQHAALPFNGERHLKTGEEMAALFRDRPDALQHAVELAERLAEPLDPLARHLPRFPKLPYGESAFSYLSALTWCGAERRYRDRFTPDVQTRLVHELETIHELGFCDYFLVCSDVCNEARRRNIGYGLRGSAVGSAVAYCLQMSNHDPIARRVSFDRFLSKSRAKPPDIDIDFRHDLRDEMMTYTRKTYGEDKVANVANYVTYRGRSLLRDLGKALGYDTPDIDRLRELLHHSRGDDLAQRLEEQPELRALGIDPDRYADLFAVCASLAGLPRHLGTHSSGIVVSDVPIAAVAPLQWAAKGVPIVTLDKDDVEAEGIGLLKMDQLSLRALTAVDIAVGRLQADDPTFDFANRDREDPDTLALIRAARTVGVFQLESPAQMALQWRLQADTFDDIIASVALIRPGPLVGGGVDPYIRGRKGLQKVTYPLPEMEPVLKETYGRILYQDQVLDVVKVVGGFTSDEADKWLKTMTKARSEEEMKSLGLLLYERAAPKGLKGKAFEKLWKQIKGFSRYGFCHGHSVAFADHAQGTAYLARHYPAQFFAAVLSVEPCGFWPVATVVAEATRRGVPSLAPCVNASEGNTWIVQEDDQQQRQKIRCSLSFVKSMSDEAADAVVMEREERGMFVSLSDFARRCGSFLSREQAEWLALAGALDGLCSSRRETLWSLPVLRLLPKASGRAQVVQAAGQSAFGMEVPPFLPRNVGDFTPGERFTRQWEAIGFSPDGHPMTPYRESMQQQGVLSCAALQMAQAGTVVTIAGMSLRPHRPPTPSGQVFVFLTLEDETGLAQVTVTPDVYETCGDQLFGHQFLVVEGVAEQRGSGILLKAVKVQGF